MFGYGRPRFSAWLCLAMFGYVWLCLATLGHACVPMFAQWRRQSKSVPHRQHLCAHGERAVGPGRDVADLPSCVSVPQQKTFALLQKLYPKLIRLLIRIARVLCMGLRLCGPLNIFRRFRNVHDDRQRQLAHLAESFDGGSGGGGGGDGGGGDGGDGSGGDRGGDRGGGGVV